MKMYRVFPNLVKYKQLSLSPISIAKQLGIDINSQEFTEYMDVSRADKPVIGKWGDISAEIKADPGFPEAIEVPDISVWNRAALVVTKPVKQYLGKALSPYGEFLPIKIHDEFTFYIFHILNRGEIDAESCEYEIYKDEAEGIEVKIPTKMAFAKDESEKNALCYNVHEGYGDIYCSDDFKNSIEELDFEGLEFEVIQDL